MRRTPRSRRPIAAALAAVTLFLAACGDDAPARELVGYRPSAQQVVGTASLPDASDGDAPFAFAAPAGHVLVTYFGYTSCPDVCPTTLSDLRNALKALGDDASRVEVAMATVDPDRDTGEILTGYVQSFVGDAHALRTDDPVALQRAADAFGVTYSVTKAADGSIEVAHSGALYAVDPSGDVMLTWPFGVTSDDLAADLRALLDQVPS